MGWLGFRGGRGLPASQQTTKLLAFLRKSRYGSFRAIQDAAPWQERLELKQIGVSRIKDSRIRYRLPTVWAVDFGFKGLSGFRVLGDLGFGGEGGGVESLARLRDAGIKQQALSGC